MTTKKTTCSLFEKVTHFAEAHQLLQSDVIIIGFSGGPDSRFLLEWVTDCYPHKTIIAAHMNHGWRVESDLEAAWCKKIAEEKNIQFIEGHLHAYAPPQKTGSLEATARIARRNFLESIARIHQGIIVLGHHQDDQVETFFIRLTRGTTIDGITCMQPKNGLYERPLLDITKQVILQALKKQNITFCTDTTNTNTHFLRNHIRSHIIPQLEPRALRNIIRFMQSAYEVKHEINNYLNSLIRTISHQYDNETLINKNEFFKKSDYIQKKIIVHLLINTKIACTIQETLCDEIIRFLQSSLKHEHKLTKNITIKQDKQHFTIKKL